MPGLVDIAPLRETVEVRGTEIEVTGVSAMGFAQLLARFPDLRKMMSGVRVEAESLPTLLGEAIGPVIAAGTGSLGDKKAEAVAASLSVGDQMHLLEAIFNVTFPRGTGPLVELLGGLAGSPEGAASPTAQVTK